MKPNDADFESSTTLLHPHHISSASKAQNVYPHYFGNARRHCIQSKIYRSRDMTSFRASTRCPPPNPIYFLYQIGVGPSRKGPRSISGTLCSFIPSPLAQTCIFMHVSLSRHKVQGYLGMAAAIGRATESQIGDVIVGEQTILRRMSYLASSGSDCTPRDIVLKSTRIWWWE